MERKEAEAQIEKEKAKQCLATEMNAKALLRDTVSKRMPGKTENTL